MDNRQDIPAPTPLEIAAGFRTRPLAIRRTDPVEATVQHALDKVGVYYRSEHECAHALDFCLPDYGVHIECKRFHSERSANQLSRADNVILIQGMEAARFFARAITGGFHER